MKITLLVIFITLSGAVYSKLHYDKNNKIKNYLTKQTKTISLMHKYHLKSIKEKSDNEINEIIERQEVIDIYKKLKTANTELKNKLRDELKNLLIAKYNHLRAHKVNQLHFHLPNSESFLRFHKLKKYGDSLVGIRETVDYVNKTGKSINGFEIGRHYSGYRFVYAIKDGKTHLGSVEISYDATTLTTEIMKNAKVLSGFHIKNNAIDKKVWNDAKQQYYVKSPIKGHYCEKISIVIAKKNQNKNLKQGRIVKSLIIKQLLNTIYKGTMLSVYNAKLRRIITFIPEKNPVTREVIGFYTIKANGQYIADIITNYYIMLFVINILLLIIFIYIYREFKSQTNMNTILEEKIEERTSELKQEKEQFQKIFDGTKDAIGILDMQLNFLDVNQAYIDMTGFTKEELLKSSCIKLTTPNYVEASKKAMKEVMKVGFIKNFEKDCITKGSKYISVNMSMALLYNPDRVLINARDVSEVKYKEQQLFEQSKLASMGKMIANIAHQWRQPLSVITSHTNNIKIKKALDTLNDKILDEGLTGIEDSAHYLSDTIDTFQNFIKEDRILKEVIIQDRINKAISIVTPMIKGNFIELKHNLDNVSPIKITLVLGELLQVIINILNNAKDILLEKKIEHPWIELNLIQEEDKVVITIEDNGGGIPNDIMPKIFEPYFTTKHQSQGTGLGLHMSYKIITESFKGNLYAQNTQNGAKFFIKIPMNKDDDKMIDKELLKTIQVLYVEDEANCRNEVCKPLSRFIKEIVIAENGKDGLAQFNKLKDIDLIITDILMPKMNGIEMIEEIRKTNNNIPIIVTTAYGLNNSYLKKLSEIEGIEYVKKPIIIKDLLKSINKLIYQKVL